MDLRSQVWELREAKVPVCEIAKAVGRSDGWVYGIIREREGPLSPRFPKDDEAAVCAAYLAGETASELARQFGVTHHTIIRALKRNDVVLRRNRGGQFTEEEVAEVVRRWKEGEGLRSIREVFQTSIPILKNLLRRNGYEPEWLTRRGAANPQWKGGRHINDDGYVLLWADPDHPFFAMSSGSKDGKSSRYFFEHRLVMAESLGRVLNRGEQVHHINGIKDDNRIENLQLRQGGHGSGSVYRCCDCGSENVKAHPLG